jgi:hypothetical protein
MFTPARLLGILAVGLGLPLCATARPGTAEQSLSGDLRRVEQQIEKKEWAAATALLQRWLDREQDVFVTVTGNDLQRTVGLKAEAARLLGTLPKEGLAFYEKEYGPRAAVLLEQARGTGDVRRLAEVAKRYPYTRAGARATAHLAGHCFDRAQYPDAAAWFERLFLVAGPDNLSPATLFKATVAYHAAHLKIGPVRPKKDPRTGFVVGGKNATALVRKLGEINGITIADLEDRMRPGIGASRSQAGFLGKDESLLKVLAADNRYVVDELGSTHQELAKHLHVLGTVGRLQFRNGQQYREFTYHGRRFKVIKFTATHGTQPSPFNDGTWTQNDAIIQNRDSGKTLGFSLLVPFMIERYGFYEGKGTSYRVDPRKVVEVLDFLEKGKAPPAGRQGQTPPRPAGQAPTGPEGFGARGDPLTGARGKKCIREAPTTVFQVDA